jgi:hypothetical protein
MSFPLVLLCWVTCGKVALRAASKADAIGGWLDRRYESKTSKLADCVDCDLSPDGGDP